MRQRMVAFLITVSLLCGCKPVFIESPETAATPIPADSAEIFDMPGEVHYDIHGNVIPESGTITIDENNLLDYLQITFGASSDGNDENPMLAGLSYSCSYYGGPPVPVEADVSFDIVFDCDVTAHVHFVGEPIQADVPVPSPPVPFPERGPDYTYQNVVGYVTF